MEPDVIMAPCCEAMQGNDAGLQYDGDSVAGANVRTGASGPWLACKWVTDITEIKTDEGKLYLCIVLDLFDHRVVGWSMHHRQDRQMVILAVQMAVW